MSEYASDCIDDKSQSKRNGKNGSQRILDVERRADDVEFVRVVAIFQAH